MRAECAAAAARYALSLPHRPTGGRIGDRLGRGTGASIEFTDFRDYQPGDDPRHVDWRAYARTDQVKVRLYREEVAPVLDIVVDGSASMASTPLKAQAVLDLCAALRDWVRRANGGRLRLHVAGGALVDDAAAPQLGGEQRELRPSVPPWPRGLRMLISDFLFPGDPSGDVRRLAAGGSHLWVLQVLDPGELDPSLAGPCTLIDCEDGARIDIVLDEAASRRYRDRLARLCAGARDATRRAGGTWASVRAAEPAAMFGDLLRQGVVEAAS